MLAPCPHLIQGDGLLAVDLLHGQVLGLHNGSQTLADAFIHMEQVAHAQGLLHEFVAVGVGDAPLGGTELCAGLGQTGFLQAILVHMEGHGDGGTVGNLQVVRGDGDALVTQLRDLSLQVMGIDDHAAAHDADDLRAQNARGDQVENELSALILDSMAGVVAALVPCNNVIVAAEQVDHAALALVAPVDSGDCSKHNVTSFMVERTAFSAQFARDPPPHTL